MQFVIFATENKEISDENSVELPTLASALRPLKQKALLSHFLEKNLIQKCIVVVNSFEEQIRGYLNLAHPEVEYVLVNNQNALMFELSKNSDTEDIYVWFSDYYFKESVKNKESNWIGIYHKDTSIDFSGIVSVQSPLFLEGLQKNNLDIEKLSQSDALRFFQKLNLQKKEIHSFDVGRSADYFKLCNQKNEYDFSKTDECIYFVNGRVIKFFSEALVAEQRVQKAKQAEAGVFPKIERHEGCFYSYQYQEGIVLYQEASTKILSKLISWLEEKFWILKTIEPRAFQKTCKDFYKVKTENRLLKYQQKYLGFNEIKSINGELVPSVADLLAEISWNELYDGRPYFIHGDLQPDNIIYNSETDNFILLDWRQEFGGAVEYGDIYYDLAKLWGGILVDYSQIKQKKFSYQEDDKGCWIEFPSHPFKTEALSYLEDWISKKGFSIHKVKVIVGLIYLNMSPLHHYPFDKMIHALGRKMLYETLRNKAL